MSKGSGVAKSPSAAVEPVEHRQTVITVMSDHHSKPLTGAGRWRRPRRRHLLGRSAAGGCLRQARRGGSEAFTAGQHKIVNRLALFDFGMQGEPCMSGFV